MTKATFTVDVSNFSTDAKWRALGSAISTAMAAGGFVKTSDTGQIDWTTSTKLPTTGALGGYEIWRFNDSLQATKPIYFKISYLTNSSMASGNSMYTQIVVGTGSNGSGTITGLQTGTFSTGYQGSSGYNNTTMSGQVTHSTANGYGLLNFGLVPASGAVSSEITLAIIERTKDANGNPTGSGVGVWYHVCNTVGASFWFFQGINFDNAIAYQTARNPYCGVLATTLSLASGASIPFYRHYHGLGTPYSANGMLSFYYLDVASFTTFASAPLGSTARTYYAWRDAYGCDAAASNSIASAWMWED